MNDVSNPRIETVLDPPGDTDITRFAISVDPHPISARPATRSEAGGISNRLQSTECTLTELIELLETGHTFAPAEFGGSRSNANWISQQIFCLDVDGKINEKEAHARCKRYGIMPSFVYYTFRHTPEAPRFRMAFQLDQRICDYRLKSLVINALLTIFPECDKQCADASRMFYPAKPGSTVRVFPEMMITLPDILTSAVAYIRDTDESGHSARKIEALCSTASLNMINGYPSCIPTDTVTLVQDDKTVVYRIAAASKLHDGSCISAQPTTAATPSTPAAPNLATSQGGSLYIVSGGGKMIQIWRNENVPLVS